MSLRKLLAEPLLHFIALGAVVFMAYGAWESNSGDARLIRVGAATERGLADDFRAATGRAPSESELAGLVEGWVRNEILYREGLASGLDRDDAEIRRLVVNKMRSLLRNRVMPGEPDPETLELWFSERRQDYAEARRYSFRQIPLAPKRDTRAYAQNLLDLVRGGTDPTELGHAPRTVQGRSRHQVRSIFGKAFADALDTMDPAEWALLKSPRGLHLVQLEQISGGGEPEFEQVRERVREDWQRARTLTLIAELTEGLRASYRVVRDEP